MKNIYLSTMIAAVLLATTISASAQTSSWTFQGKLTDTLVDANGPYDFTFKLYDQLANGTQIGSDVVVSDTNVVNGIFTVQLDFGAAAFTVGAARFVEIHVRPGASTGAFTILAPRQEIKSSPFAIKSLNADTATTAINSTQLGGILANNYLLVNGNGSQLTNISGAIKWNAINADTPALPNNGYLSTSDSQVTVTLPANPAVSDIVRVSSSNGSGWKVAQNAGQSIFSTNFGAIGGVWTQRDSIRQWEGLASSADGTKLVAAVAGSGGGPGPAGLYTSTDAGVTWILRDSPRAWWRVASSADGTKLAATDLTGFIYTSTDSGATWTQRAISANWWGIASSSDGTKLIAASVNNLVYTSSDSGVTWTPISIPGAGTQFLNVASSADGTKLVVGNLNKVFRSTDSGATWINVGLPVGQYYSVATSADGTKIVVGPGDGVSGQTYVSTDSGTTWTARDSVRAWHSYSMSADGSTIVGTVFGGQVYVSTNGGLTWIPRDSARAWRSSAISADGTKMAAGVGGGFVYTSSPSTTFGTTGFLTGSAFSAVELQYAGSGKFVVLSSAGTLTPN